MAPVAQDALPSAARGRGGAPIGERVGVLEGGLELEKDLAIRPAVRDGRAVEEEDEDEEEDRSGARGLRKDVAWDHHGLWW